MARAQKATAEPVVDQEANAEPAWQAIAFAEWLKQEHEVEVDPAVIRLVTSKRNTFRKSDTYLNAKAEQESGKEEREAEKARKAQEREEARAKREAEREAKKAERAAAAEKAKAEKAAAKENKGKTEATKTAEKPQKAATGKASGKGGKAPF